METSTNSKRRRDCGDSPPKGEKKTMQEVSTPTPITCSVTVKVTTAVTTRHLKNSLHHWHHFNTPSPNIPFFLPNHIQTKHHLPQIKLQPHWNNHLCPPSPLHCLPSFSSLSSPSPFCRSHSTSRHPKPPIGLIETPLQSQVGLNGRLIRPAKTLTMLCGVWGASCRLSAPRSTKTVPKFGPHRGKSSQTLLIQRFSHDDHLCSLGW